MTFTWTLLLSALWSIFFSANLAEAKPIPHHFVIDSAGYVHRSANVAESISELKQAGIKNVVILRDAHEKGIEDERKALSRVGIRSVWLPMKWNRPEDPKLNCTNAVKAIQAIQASVRRGEKVLFHCTAGQDRTGLVSGLYRMLVQNWSAQKAFRGEMCARGYADGGPPSKPDWINREVRASLTPVFLALSREIERTGQLTESACRQLPSGPLPYCR